MTTANGMQFHITNPTYFDCATRAYQMLLYTVMNDGVEVAPRGLPIKEIPNATVRFPLNKPGTYLRNADPKFAAAEALWILRGQRDVEPLAKHAPSIRRFSDDGTHLAGAYGPPFLRQLRYVVDTLERDAVSRQAVMTFWQQSPEPSKDIPCTVSLVFTVRPVALTSQPALYVTAFMRSSDLWLGFPYDMTSFACMAALVASRLNERREQVGHAPVLPGALTYTAVSCHLYRERWERAYELANLPGDDETWRLVNQRRMPSEFFEANGSRRLTTTLAEVERGDLNSMSTWHWWLPGIGGWGHWRTEAAR